MLNIDRRECQERLNGAGARQRTHEGEPISRAHHHINKGNRPGQNTKTSKDWLADSAQARGLERINTVCK